MQTINKKDGFIGEKIIVIPPNSISGYVHHPLVAPMYPTDAGYFPSASYHKIHRNRGALEYILLYCVSGSGTVILPKKTYTLISGNILCIPLGVKHTYKADESDPWSLLWVHFKGDECKLFPLEEAKIIECEHIKEQERVQTIFKLLFDALESSYTIGNFIHASQLTSALLSEIYFKEKSESESTQRHTFTKAVRYMNEHIEKHLTLQDISSHLKISMSYVHTLFKMHTKQSPIEFFIRLKIEQACRYLSLTDYQVQEIAQRLGYSDVGYFSRTFKKIIGTSPRKYREGIGIDQSLPFSNVLQ